MDHLAHVEGPGEVQAHDGHPGEHQEVGQVAKVSQCHAPGVVINSHVDTNPAVIAGISRLFIEHNEIEDVDEDSADDVGDDNLPVEGGNWQTP